ncbi:Copper binding protein, plastocyanin/azurin family [Clostridiaceae bacterium JG1575]|nr:Copper binding protein, plastocyanin/azurin family [Clostridiaceae bacterium JG1575]
MNDAKRLTRSILALFLAVIFTFITAVPALARTTAPKLETLKAGKSIPMPAQAKISKLLAQEMQKEKMVEAIVYVTSPLDSEAFAKTARSRIQADTVAQKNLQVRQELYLALKDHAQTAQRNLISYLKHAKGVEAYESFFITNALFVRATPDVMKTLSTMPEVRSMEKNKITFLDKPMEAYKPVTPMAEDPQYLWHLEMVKAPSVWKAGFDGTGVVVANIDSGVDWTHPALRTHWRGLKEDGTTEATFSWFDTVAKAPLPIDSDSHGTHVMGSMVGKDPATGYTTGVAPGAKWIAARVFDPEGRTTDARLISAAQWMIAPGGNAAMAPDVVNNSWGGGNDADPWYQESVNNWIAANIFPAFAAGNQRQGEPIPQPGSISNPANYKESFAVGAVDKNSLRPSWSKRGPSAFGFPDWKPNISAPGVGITSSVPGGKYALNSGTSMATPHLSGVVALLRSTNKNMSVADLVDLLQTSAVPLTDSLPTAQKSPNYDYGYGLVDAFAAVGMATTGTGIFTGKIMKEGSDKAAPVVKHDQLIQQAYAGLDVTVDATVTDDVSVVSSTLLVRSKASDPWTNLPMIQKEGDHTGGLFEAKIPGAMVLEGKLSYRISATDFVGNVTNSPIHEVNIVFGARPDQYKEGFEGEALGWTFLTIWSRGPKKIDAEPTPVEGKQYAGTSIGGKYPNSTEAFMVSAPIDLRKATEASARFFHWYEFGASAGDNGTLLVSNDNFETMTEVTSFQGNSKEWKGVTVNLKPWAGSKTPVYLIYKFKSDLFSNNLGWYVDDFSLVGEDKIAPKIPANLKGEAKISGMRLTWDANHEADFDKYNVYRSTTKGERGTLVGSPMTPSFNDPYASLDMETTYYYSVTALDASGNESKPSEQVTIKPLAGIATIVFHNFEDTNGEFTKGQEPGGNDWAWGVVETAGPKKAYSGTKAWATNLKGNYSNNIKNYLETPAFTLPAEYQISLIFAHWYEFEISSTGKKYDFATISLSHEEGKWIDITPGEDKKIGGASTDWTLLELDLTAYAGKAVKIRFNYQTDITGPRAGWYIDDFNIVAAPKGTGGSIQEPMVVSSAIQKSPTGKRESAASLKKLLSDKRVTKKQSLTNNNHLSDIPVILAQAEVVETGVMVKSDPKTGDYRLRHMASKEDKPWTLKASSYGFKPQTFQSKLAKGETILKNFVLQPEDSGSIKGRVMDRYDGTPAPGITIHLLEDPNVAPVVTNDKGEFTFPSVYVGQYTLHAAGPGFRKGTAQVTVKKDEVATVDIKLERLIGAPGEIIYDDGAAEDATVLKSAGNGVATLFTPKDFGTVTGVKVFFYDKSFPTPGGNEIGFAIFEKDGSNWKQVGSTIFRKDIVRGEWNTIDLSSLNFSTGEDFFITTIQNKIGEESPAVAVDYQGPVERGYYYANGGFVDFKSQDSKGVPMMRAQMMFAAEKPELTNLADTTYTNEDSIMVEGRVKTAGEVRVYCNDKVVATIKEAELQDKTFNAKVLLPEETNKIKASLVVNGKETEPTKDYVVIKDKTAPELTVTEPVNKARLNVEMVHVKGTVKDAYLDHLSINGTSYEVSEKGAFDIRIFLNEGENKLTIEAVDKAGNKKTELRTVTVKLGASEGIKNMQPDKDVTLAPGATLKLSFEAEKGAKAGYNIIVPLSTAAAEDVWIPMTEKEPGHYEAVWTAPKTPIKGAQVLFHLNDGYGNTSIAKAPGKITVEEPEPEITGVSRVAGKDAYETSALMSQKTFKKAQTVVLATKKTFADALVGGLYAVQKDAPILLSDTKEVPKVVLEEIKRLGAQKVVLLGGELALDPAVAEQLKTMNLKVERLAGSDRYRTAVAINEAVREGATKHIYLVSGRKFTDALGIVPVAANAKDGILLTERQQIPNATLGAMRKWGIDSVTLLGGTNAISEDVEKELKDWGFKVGRLVGETRYDTNIQLTKKFYKTVTDAIGASGEAFPDALVSTVYAAKMNQPILLLNPKGLDEVTLQYVKEAKMKRMILMGGEQTIPEAIEKVLKDWIQ